MTHFIKTIKTEVFQNNNWGWGVREGEAICDFLFGRPALDLGHLNSSVTGLDGPPTFKTDLQSGFIAATGTYKLTA